MPFEVISLSCPGCGAAVSTEQKKCDYCGNPIIISSFSSVADFPLPQVNKYVGSYRKSLAENPDNPDLNNAIGICYLRLKMYDKALVSFEKAMEDNFDNAEPFFLAAVCLLQGKKPFLTLRPVIDKIEEYLNAATMIEQRGLFYYFMAYIKQDYYSRKFFKTSPTHQELLVTAAEYGVTDTDINTLHTILGTPRPSEI